MIGLQNNVSKFMTRLAPITLKFSQKTVSNFQGPSLFSKMELMNLP